MVSDAKPVGAPPDTTKSQPQEVQPGKRTVVEKPEDRETLSKIAAQLSRKLGIKVTLDDLYLYNPRFNPSKAGINDGSWLDHSNYGKQGQDPDLIKPGEMILVPTSKEQLLQVRQGARAVLQGHDQDTVGGQDPSVSREQPRQLTPESTLHPQQVAAEKKARTDGTQPDATQTTPEAKIEAKTEAKTEETKPEETKPRETKPEEKSTFRKIFDTIGKVFKNPIFQGLLAILASIPGIGVFACGVGAAFGLMLVIDAMVRDWKKPPLALIASTLLYISGFFIPGLGAFGGLLGMTAATDDKPDSKGRGAREDARSEKKDAALDRQQRAKEDRAAEAGKAQTARAGPLSDADFGQAYLLASQVPDLQHDDQSVIDAWLDKVRTLVEHRQYLLGRGQQAAQDLSQAEKAARLDKIDRFLGGTLPAMLLPQQVRAAFGIDNVEPSQEPEAGRLYLVQESDTKSDKPLETLAARAAKSSNRVPGEMLEAIRAYNQPLLANGLAPGMTLFIPTFQPGTSFSQPIAIAHAEQLPHKNRLSQASSYLAGINTPIARRAHDVGIISAPMAVAPTAYEVEGPQAKVEAALPPP